MIIGISEDFASCSVAQLLEVMQCKPHSKMLNTEKEIASFLRGGFFLLQSKNSSTCTQWVVQKVPQCDTQPWNFFLSHSRWSFGQEVTFRTRFLRCRTLSLLYRRVKLLCLGFHYKGRGQTQVEFCSAGFNPSKFYGTQNHSSFKEMPIQDNWSIQSFSIGRISCFPTSPKRLVISLMPTQESL